MTEPKVSIIIPSHNYGHLIAETLSNLLEQTYSFWEAIIVDDGSTDNTEQIVSQFLEKDQRFVYIKQNNKGVSVARNTGLKKASGTFIQFLDADDLISRSKLENQVAYLEANPNVDVVCVKTAYFSMSLATLYSDLSLKNETDTPQITGSGVEVIASLVERNQMVIQSPLFKRSTLMSIGCFDERMNYLEDWDLWFRMAIHNDVFAFLNDEKSMAYVRVHQKSATKISNKIHEAEAMLRSKINNYIKESNFLSSAEKVSLKIQNDNLLIKTYKMLMAETPLADLKKWIFYYRELKSNRIFWSCLIKALNMKRKMM